MSFPEERFLVLQHACGERRFDILDVDRRLWKFESQESPESLHGVRRHHGSVSHKFKHGWNGVVFFSFALLNSDQRVFGGDEPQPQHVTEEGTQQDDDSRRPGLKRFSLVQAKQVICDAHLSTMILLPSAGASTDTRTPSLSFHVETKGGVIHCKNERKITSMVHSVRLARKNLSAGQSVNVVGEHQTNDFLHRSKGNAAL